jgi:hypothetical protein
MRPAIGFDRDIKLEWLDATATQVAAGKNSNEVRTAVHKVLSPVLSSGRPGSALTKTTTVLLRIWSRVPESAAGLRNRIAGVLPELSPEDRLAGHWSLCLATHPFFLDVATNVGRLLGLQGDVSIVSLRRRLAEHWGDRSLMPQATSKVLRSMVSWGTLGNAKPGIYRAMPTSLTIGSRASLFLAEALVVGSGKRSLAVQEIERHPALFPFRTHLTAATLRGAKQFSLHRQGVDLEMVELT